MRRILGIDPGKDGAFVLLFFDGDQITDHYAVELAPMVAGKQWDAVHNLVTGELRTLHATYRIDAAVLERASTRPGESGRSALTIGLGWGVLLGALSALGIPVTMPTPARWVAGLLADMPGENKDRAIALCQQRVPGLDLCTGPTGRKRRAHTGLADAACLALFGAR